MEHVSPAARIEEELHREGIDVEAGFDGENIVLTGSVMSGAARDLAETIALHFAGGRPVENSIDVLEGNPLHIDDEVLELEELEPDFAGQYPGAGFAEPAEESTEDAAFAPTDPVATGQEIIGGFEGTSMDSMEVDPSALDDQPGDEALADAIRRELREDAATAGLAIRVAVRRGVARLRGTVPTLEDVENAEEVAGRIPAVREVLDELQIAGT